MIEVNLYSIPVQDPESMVGRCVARSRFNKEGMGVSIMEFVKGFLKENLDKFETSVANADLITFINNGTVMSTKDLASINYCLSKVGFKVQIQNVADDEEDAVGVPEGVVEWNVIDRNFLQYDYPTATKLVPAPGSDISETLDTIVKQSGLFDNNKFKGVKNPFVELIGNLKKIKTTTGSISPAITSQIYNLLSQMGIDVFCATSED